MAANNKRLASEAFTGIAHHHEGPRAKLGPLSEAPTIPPSTGFLFDFYHYNVVYGQLPCGEEGTSWVPIQSIEYQRRTKDEETGEVRLRWESYACPEWNLTLVIAKNPGERPCYDFKLSGSNVPKDCFLDYVYEASHRAASQASRRVGLIFSSCTGGFTCCIQLSGDVIDEGCALPAPLHCPI